MISSWFERGRIGQIVAPDEKVKSISKEEREEEEMGFWSVVAPRQHEEEEQKRDSPSSALSPDYGSFDQVKCVNCSHMTPVKPLTPSPRTMTAADNNSSDTRRSDLETRVLSAAKETAESIISPPAVADVRNKVFRLCASSKPLAPKAVGRLRSLLKNDPSLARARASHLGNLAPDGFTPLLAAASVNNVEAAKIILAECPKTVDDVDREGQTALHIASWHGCADMVELLKSMYPEGPDAPVNLVGQTPFGQAATSTHKAAKQNQSRLREHLFSPGDVSVCGKATPAKTRSFSQFNLRLVFGYAEMPGWRVKMEDAIACHEWPGYALFGVCDGHGDQGLVSRFVADGVAPILQNQLSVCAENGNDAWTATCLELDAQLKGTGRKGGSTAVFALVTDTSVIVANVGDSRCILIHKPGLEQAMDQLSINDEQPEEATNAEESTIAVGERQPAVDAETQSSYIVTPLSEDHKPNLELEKARIEKAGLSVTVETFEDDGGVCTIHKVQRSETDRLAVARAFGDFEYKSNAELPADEQAVVAVPEIRAHARDEDRDMYLVLACDGVWDVMSSQEVGDFVVKHTQEATDAGEEYVLPKVGDMLLEEALRRKSRDNMSVVIVGLSNAADALCVSSVKKSLDFQVE